MPNPSAAKSRPAWHTEVLEWVRVLLTAGLIALAVRWSIGEPYHIPSGSMEPTLHGDPRFARGDRVWVNKFVYGLRYPFQNKRIWQGNEPERFEIVVFKAVEEDAEHNTLVKRVVGLPGEEVRIGRGRVYIDGEPLGLPPEMEDITYTRRGEYGVRATSEYSIVPESHYFLLGDNSDVSRDGRVFGWVPNSHIVGRVACIWWPPSRWHDFTGFSETLWWRSSVALLACLAIWRLFLGRSLPAYTPYLSRAVSQGDKLYVHRIAFGLPLPFTPFRILPGRKPRRGEWVAYVPPDGQLPDDYPWLLGRVAALPGEKVEFRENKLIVNGKPPLDVPPLAYERYPGIQTIRAGMANADGQALRVPKGHYYILAEGTNYVPDSRMLGSVPKNRLFGPVTLVWWPPWRAKRLPE